MSDNSDRDMGQVLGLILRRQKCLLNCIPGGGDGVDVAARAHRQESAARSVAALLLPVQLLQCDSVSAEPDGNDQKDGCKVQHVAQHH